MMAVPITTKSSSQTILKANDLIVNSTTYKSNPSLSDIRSHYDGNNLDNYYRKRPLEVFTRLFEIGYPVLGWYIRKSFDNITAPFNTNEQNQDLVNIRAAELKDAIVSGKSVTFIKSGQALALRPDLVKSREYVRELQKLQDEVGTFSNDIAMDIIAKELGNDPFDVFEFDPILPIASASIGQVYRAKLKSNDKLVAVKVQRPDALEKAAIDMYILRSIARIVKEKKKLRSDLVGIADEFGKQLYNELNYRQEAKNCERFKDLYGDIPGIRVPDVYFNYTSQRVLTMEFIEGTKGPWLSGGERMLTIGLQCSVLQLLGTGYFHSDPHRGNLLQTPSGELAYLDFGMMAEVPAEKRFALIGTVLGLVNKDFGLVISNMKELNFFPPETDTDVVVDALKSALMNSTDNGKASSLNFTRLNKNLEGISGLLPFRLPPFYTMIIRSLTILEGLALFVDPNFRLVKGAYPFIARQILTEPSPEMNNMLKTILLTSEGRIKWDQLEKFISISSNADRAMSGDFSALKSAQDRSDLMKTYQTSSDNNINNNNNNDNFEDSNFTLDVLVKIMDYITSVNGDFLREALVQEMADTIDSVGLTSQAIASLLTNGILPEPHDKPDKEKITRLLKLFSIITSSAVATNPSNNNTSSVSPFIRIITIITGFINDYNSNNNNPPQQIQKLLLKSSGLINNVVMTLIERNT
eukprot:gene10580-14211_t